MAMGISISPPLFPLANAPSQVAVFLNQGATAPGVFATPTLYAAPSGATGLLAGDFNGDGKQDLITTIYTVGGTGDPDGVYRGYRFLRERGRHAEGADDTIGSSLLQLHCRRL